MPQLTWQGKSIRTPQPATLAVESIITPQPRQPALFAAAPAAPTPSTPPPANWLVHAENFSLLGSLANSHAGKLRLIYIDPPFFTNRNFKARLGRQEDSRKPAEWQMAEGYGDNWNSLDDYLDFLYQRLRLMRLLLAEDGSLYLHLDWHANSYARLILDEVFGEENLLNEIIWTYHGPSPIRTAFNRKHDTILAYTKSANYLFNVDDIRVPYDENTRKTFQSSAKAGFGKVPNLDRGKVPEDWWYFPVVARLHSERTGYPTQKPQALLQRIILASTNPGDLVADFFCGSGTTAATAAQLGRSFITCDESLRAVQTTHERLVRQGSPPFSILAAENGGYLPGTAQTPRFACANGKIWLTDPQNVAYWEVDPHFDGATFRSTLQAGTSNRNEYVEAEITLPAETKKIAARAILKTGQVDQQVFAER